MNQPQPNQSQSIPLNQTTKRYWHKGAFFQETADDARGTSGGYEILKRDYSAPTGEDRGTDKAALPKVMQVRVGRLYIYDDDDDDDDGVGGWVGREGGLCCCAGGWGEREGAARAGQGSRG